MGCDGMSYYDDQEEAWFANDCKGSPSDYDPYDADSWPEDRRSPTPNKEELTLLKTLEDAAKDKGLKCSCHGNGHFQIRAGRKVVNWYPLSKRQMAYENVSGEKRFRLSAAQVVEFALERKEVTA